MKFCCSLVAVVDSEIAALAQAWGLLLALLGASSLPLGLVISAMMTVSHWQNSRYKPHMLIIQTVLF